MLFLSLLHTVTGSTVAGAVFMILVNMDELRRLLMSSTQFSFRYIIAGNRITILICCCLNGDITAPGIFGLVTTGDHIGRQGTTLRQRFDIITAGILPWNLYCFIFVAIVCRFFSSRWLSLDDIVLDI